MPLNSAAQKDSATEVENSTLTEVLRSALNAIPEGFVVYDDKDNLVFFNEAYARIYSHSAPAIKQGATFESILRYGLDNGQYPEAGDTAEETEAWLHQRLRLHRAADRRLEQKVGEGKWLQIEERKLPSGHIVGIRSDISAIKLIQRNVERFGEIVERSVQEIFIVDADTLKFVGANKGARDNLGYSLEEIQGMTPLEINPTIERSSIETLFRPLRDGETESVEITTRHRRRDGSEYPCRMVMHVDRAGGNDIIVGFAEDLTLRHALETEIAQSRRDLESLLRNIPDIVTRALPDTTLTYVNRQYRTLVGGEDDDLIGRSFLDMIDEEYRETIRDELLTLTPDDPIRYSTERIRDANGMSRTLRWSNLMVFEAGQPVEIVSVGRDVSDLSAANEALLAANEELQGFAYAASHDLRSPIQTMRSLLNVLEEDYLADLPDDARAIIGRLSGVADRMLQLSNGVLDYARISGAPPPVSTFDTNALVGGIIANLEAQVAETGAQVTVGPLPELRGVKPQIGQVFQNLIGNALKFSVDSDPPTIAIEATRLASAWRFTVRDNGIGLTDTDAEEVFLPFRRLHGRKRFEGSGLGLTICRKVVEAHGGIISAAPNEGPGSTFSFILPEVNDV